MENQQPIWGVTGLSEGEQRQVRGGSRASCIRQAMQTYISRIRFQGWGRTSARASMLQEIAICGQCG